MFGTFAPGDPNRLFLGRIYNGQIEILDLATRTLLPQPFLSISDLPSPIGFEQGLLGLTFDPDYARNGFFYVNYTGADNSINVVRYQVVGDPETSNLADPASAHHIFTLSKGDWTWHNAGWIDFGPKDGYLYISTGDPCCGNAQITTNNLHGKVLRIDVGGDDFPDDSMRNYTIPPTNPLVGVEGDDEIWAYGLRNPWRASFDRLTGDLWINDTGEATREEVNYQPANSPGGLNYGWPLREGMTGTSPPSPEWIEPVFDYPHAGADPLFRGLAITAAGFYRGPVDAFYGHYIFADYASRNLWKLDPDAIDRRASVTNINHLLLPDVGFLSQIASFGEDAAGNLYLMDIKFGAGYATDIYLVATHSKSIVWNGDGAFAGMAGDGMTWEDANNWTRDGVVDSRFVAEDSVIFGAGASNAVIELGDDQTVAAVTFQSPYRLKGHTLTVLSGNVFVEDAVTATIDSTLSAETVNHSIRKLGLGTLVVNGSAGQMVVKEGALGGNGTLDYLTVREGGVAAPGDSIGVMNIVESFTMHDGATLQIELNGVDNSNPLAPQYDQIVVGGVLEAKGTLDVVLFGDEIPFMPSVGDTFTIISAAGGITGEFSRINLPYLAGGLAWNLDWVDGKALILSARATLRSDYNGNGVVDTADYVVWRNLAGQIGNGLAADGSGPGGMPDGIVNDWDYNYWRANFGKSIEMLPGDYNRNGVVDASDYVVWRKSYGQIGNGLAADGSGPGGMPDGIVNDWDYSYWRANFGKSIEMLPGDYDRNGVVDASDYVVWRKSYGQIGNGLAADGSGPGGMPDGIVNDWDYNYWRANFGKSNDVATRSLLQAPAPSGWLLMLLGAIGWSQTLSRTNASAFRGKRARISAPRLSRLWVCRAWLRAGQRAAMFHFWRLAT
jgi:hypothetical protein